MSNLRVMVDWTLKSCAPQYWGDVGFSSRTWKPDEVTVSLPGSSSANPVKLRLFGCTTEAHAVHEGLYLAAANRYRQRIITLHI
ncbi:phage tail protein [Laribacter hongkongensis]|uniref:phage tail protein n=1 Tax=Laribacter hongkongensis TaxID=168471 RepID=UPI001EFE3C77|nr:phage tail protein [Laribacter hongkongensis]MCG9033193.1 phage tail protein [Laribacter hongkongensis]MCG9093074.1 phage tail protein [Laribacter hongkongensis]